MGLYQDKGAMAWPPYFIKVRGCPSVREIQKVEAVSTQYEDLGESIVWKAEVGRWKSIWFYGRKIHHMCYFYYQIAAGEIFRIEKEVLSQICLQGWD